MNRTKIEEARKQLALMRIDIGTYFLGAENFRHRMDKIDRLLKEATADVAVDSDMLDRTNNGGNDLNMGNSERGLLKCQQGLEVRL
jgi:hypothetical protein